MKYPPMGQPPLRQPSMGQPPLSCGITCYGITCYEITCYGLTCYGITFFGIICSVRVCCCLLFFSKGREGRVGMDKTLPELYLAYWFLVRYVSPIANFWA